MNPAFDAIGRFRHLRVTVVGDVMLDRYLAGHARRISPEAPVPVVDVTQTYERAGGAGNVAANVRQLGAKTSIVGVVGADGDGDRLRRILTDAGVDCARLMTVQSQSTTVKTRVVAQGQQIVRVDQDTDPLTPTTTALAVVDAFAELPASDVVILSDYAKGVLSHSVCAAILRNCRERRVPVVVDPKGADYRRYHGATSITPNQIEAAQAIGHEAPLDDGFAELARFFLVDLALRSALVTLGDKGMCLLLPHRPPVRLPATARDVADVTGAGDTAAGVFALGLGAGLSFVAAARLANIAAGLVVGKAGTASISSAELIDALATRSSRRSRHPTRSPVPLRESLADLDRVAP